MLRAQLPLIGAGAGLAALAVGADRPCQACRRARSGAIARISAVVIATVVGGLAAPVWLGIAASASSGTGWPSALTVALASAR